jgi:glycosyltransferase involved in cell wall biosynthesis
MRMLIVSHFFPPFNSIGAIRVGKIAKHLHRFGHDIRVLSTAHQPLSPDLPLEIPGDRVFYTDWFNLHKPVEVLFGKQRGATAKSDVSQGPLRYLLKKLWKCYRTLCYFPDMQIGWFPYAQRAGRQLLARWRPDLIYASALPFTSLLIAAALARQFRIPWVGELRDLWVDNHYYDFPEWRKRWERRLEQRTLSTAAGLVTVSEPLARRLREKYHRPTAVVLNGFAPEDFAACTGGPARGAELRIVYTGSFYEGKQDPTPLFQALRQLGPQAARVRVVFYGPGLGQVQQFARRQQVESQVEVHDPVPHRRALELQKQADLLLLLLWNHPESEGVYTGKVFEYLGARRPVLALGQPKGVVADLLRQRSAGVMLTRADEVAEYLRQWLTRKQRQGYIEPLAAQVARGLSREEQTRVLERFLVSLLPAASRKAA